MHLVRKMAHLNVLKLRGFVGSSSGPVVNITALRVWLCGFDSHPRGPTPSKIAYEISDLISDF